VRMNRALRLLRRLVAAPLVVVLTVVLVTSLPVALLVAAALSPFVAGRWRPLRLLWIGVVQLVMESAMLVVLLLLWVASGFGWQIRSPRFERMHYVLARWYLVAFFREARRVLRLRITTQGPAPDAHPGHPLLVCCRHAGPGDSLVLMYALLHWYDREPRVVLKDTLSWDPMVDILLNRIPSRFISGGPGDDVETQIAQLATDLDENDAFVIFPEGGNFTPRRRERAIEKLRERGFDAMADRAEGMRHVLAPRPGGFLAALEAAPEADVLLVAHTGLDHLLTVGDVWRELPMDKELITRWWRVSRDDIPQGREAQIDWLYSWWEDIDRWVEEHKPRDLGPPVRTRRTVTREPSRRP
jgi:1-acyl-sn-glycerol-3-phosphate acyltransferase